jgi:hypothetical protein
MRNTFKVTTVVEVMGFDSLLVESEQCWDILKRIGIESGEPYMNDEDAYKKGLEN